MKLRGPIDQLEKWIENWLEIPSLHWKKFISGYFTHVSESKSDLKPFSRPKCFLGRPVLHISFLPFRLAGLGQAQGEARADRPESAEAGGGPEAVVEAAEVAADLCAERRLDAVLDVGQARGGISVRPATNEAKPQD